jgi:hypothetical protein
MSQLRELGKRWNKEFMGIGNASSKVCLLEKDSKSGTTLEIQRKIQRRRKRNNIQNLVLQNHSMSSFVRP